MYINILSYIHHYSFLLRKLLCSIYYSLVIIINAKINAFSNTNLSASSMAVTICDEHNFEARPEEFNSQQGNDDEHRV